MLRMQDARSLLRISETKDAVYSMLGGMSKALQGWEFTGEVDEARAARLHSWTDFRPIVLALKVVVSVDTFWWEPYRDANLKGCNRASFTLKVPSPLYDAFFNSPNGYRGQYARASGLGEAANRLLLDELEDLLLGGQFNRPLDATPDRIRLSLRGTDAKVWIVEDEVEDQLAADHPAISYAPWERNTLDGQGLRAPVGSLLEVKGAWLDSEGNERRNPIKSYRSLHISERGYS